MAVKDYAEYRRKQNEKLLNEVITKPGIPDSKQFINRVGQRYGKLLVTECVGMDDKHAVYYRCKCDCGNEVILKYGQLCSGNTTSCGCNHLEKMRSMLTTHGMAGHGGKDRHRLYRIYNAMKSRCYNPNTIRWNHYGGRGIKICDEWLEYDKENKINTGFLNFYNWAMENGYEDGLSIDRIDVDGNYCPENCRWTTNFEQCNNTTANTYMTCGFYTFTISIWCKITGLTNSNILYRREHGWTDEEIICTPRYMKRGEQWRILNIPEKYLKFNKYEEFHKKPEYDK